MKLPTELRLTSLPSEPVDHDAPGNRSWDIQARAALLFLSHAATFLIGFELACYLLGYGGGR